MNRNLALWMTATMIYLLCAIGILWAVSPNVPTIETRCWLAVSIIAMLFLSFPFVWQVLQDAQKNDSH